MTVVNLFDSDLVHSAFKKEEIISVASSARLSEPYSGNNHFLCLPILVC